jgi:hypothetical protein
MRPPLLGRQDGDSSSGGGGGGGVVKHGRTAGGQRGVMLESPEVM